MHWKLLGQMRPLYLGIMAALVLFSAITLCVSLLGYNVNQTYVNTRHDNLKAVATYAASLVDPEKHRQLANESYSKALHHELLAPLVNFHHQLPKIHYLYTMTALDNKIFFVLDTTDSVLINPQADENTSSVMEEYVNFSESPEWITSLKEGKVYIDHTPFEDEYGSWISVSVPVQNADGSLAFWLGIDFDAKDYIREEQAVIRQIAVILVIALILSVLLGAAVTRAQKTIHDLQRKQHMQLMSDPLTGAYNRRYLKKNAENIWENFKIHHIPYAMIIMDIDHFKKINDTYGHDAGDICLTGLVNMLMESLRSDDHLIRMGGEEFLIILPQLGDQELLINTAERLRTQIECLCLQITDDKALQITVSIGAAIAQKADKNLEGTIKRADQYLYKAKQNGRNQVVTSSSL